MLDPQGERRAAVGPRSAHLCEHASLHDPCRVAGAAQRRTRRSMRCAARSQHEASALESSGRRRKEPNEYSGALRGRGVCCAAEPCPAAVR
eukprot:1821495-Pleurochrysis_carterae.AAC.2